MRKKHSKPILNRTQNSAFWVLIREQPQEKKSVEKSDERKETEKQAGTDKPITLVLYPQHLKKNKLDKQFTKFMEVFKKLHINIPFTDSLEQMPSYVKFMKDIL